MQDFIAAKRVLRCLKAAKLPLTYSRHDKGLWFSAYSNADWAGDLKTRNYVSGVVFKLNGQTHR